MARILVAGGLCEDEEDRALVEARQRFAGALGREIIARGHTLLGGCRTKLDRIVAESAAAAAVERKLDPKTVVRSWVTKSTKPSHQAGQILHSRMEDWSHVPRGACYPEPIEAADAVVIIGGFDGTHYAASWGRLAQKPLIPVATLGLAAAEIFEAEVASFDRRYSTRATMDDFQTLNRILPDAAPETIGAFAKDVVSLAERMTAPTDVFVVMSFAEKGHLKDAYNTFRRVCEAGGYRAFKVDHHLDANKRIVPNIVNAIRRSAFVIADVTEPRPNVYWELGYAQALGKNVIVTAQEGTQLPFDIFDIPTVFWDCQDTLETKLKERLSDFRSAGAR